MKYVFYYNTCIGRIGIAETGGAVTDLFFCGGREPQGLVVMETGLIKETAVQLAEYLEGKRRVFEIPIALEGTPFQLKVWDALTTIPYGETRSYKQIAESIGKPNACRAVGMANNRNPVAIIVPCHRVIGADGKLVGYGGGLDIKKKLLEMEKGFGT